MIERYVVSWNVQGHELLLLEAFEQRPRIFETKEEAEAIAAELVKDIGTCRVLTVVDRET